MDYYSLGYCIVHSQCQWELDLRSIAKEKAEMLVAGAGGGPIGRSRVIALDLNSHFGALLEGLKDVLNLQRLFLLITERYSSISWTTYFFSLKELNISACTRYEVSEVIGQGMEDCTKAILSSQSLERLRLHGSPSFTDAAVDYLAQFIVNSNTLQHLLIDEYIFSVYGVRLLAKIIRCSSKVHEKDRRRLRVIYNENSAMEHHSDTLYPGKEPPTELMVRHPSSEPLQTKFDDVKDLDDVLRTCPNIVQNIHLSFPTTVTVNNLLQLAQIIYNNPTLHVKGTLRVNIDDRRDTEGLDEVLRTYPNMKQYIDSCSVNVSDLPLLLHSNHIIPQVKVTVRICDGEDIKVLDEALRERPDMCKYISLSPFLNTPLCLG